MFAGVLFFTGIACIQAVYTTNLLFCFETETVRKRHKEGRNAPKGSGTRPGILARKYKAHHLHARSVKKSPAIKGLKNGFRVANHCPDLPRIELYLYSAFYKFMSSISITRLYDLLAVKMGKETAENLTSYIEERIRNDFEERSRMLATKADIRTEIAIAKTEMIKWMFIFWIGQIGATFGFILLFLKK
jgi:hypothetical protein